MSRQDFGKVFYMLYFAFVGESWIFEETRLAADSFNFTLGVFRELCRLFVKGKQKENRSRAENPLNVTLKHKMWQYSWQVTSYCLWSPWSWSLAESLPLWRLFNLFKWYSSLIFHVFMAFHFKALDHFIVCILALPSLLCAVCRLFSTPPVNVLIEAYVLTLSDTTYLCQVLRKKCR